MLYEPKFVAIMHYHAACGNKLTKRKIKDEHIMLDKEQFMGVSNLSLYC